MARAASEQQLWRALVLRTVGGLSYAEIGAKCGGVGTERARQMVGKAWQVWGLGARWAFTENRTMERLLDKTRKRARRGYWKRVLRTVRASREVRQDRASAALVSALLRAPG